jgi:hypothetical protein
MGKRTGGYAGASDILTSTANLELVPETIYVGSTHRKKNYFCEFYFYNNNDCHVKINGGDPIFLKANQNFEIDETNPMIHSFVIINANIGYSWVGVFE